MRSLCLRLVICRLVNYHFRFSLLKLQLTFSWFTGLWKHPQDKGGDFTNLEYWINLAKVLEDGKFHGLFLADHLGVYDVYKGPANPNPALLSGAQFPVGDPL
jgi:hypothetical protein